MKVCKSFAHFEREIGQYKNSVTYVCFPHKALELRLELDSLYEKISTLWKKFPLRQSGIDQKEKLQQLVDLGELIERKIEQIEWEFQKSKRCLVWVDMATKSKTHKQEFLISVYDEALPKHKSVFRNRSSSSHFNRHVARLKDIEYVTVLKPGVKYSCEISHNDSGFIKNVLVFLQQKFKKLLIPEVKYVKYTYQKHGTFGPMEYKYILSKKFNRPTVIEQITNFRDVGGPEEEVRFPFPENTSSPLYRDIKVRTNYIDPLSPYDSSQEPIVSKRGNS